MTRSQWKIVVPCILLTVLTICWVLFGGRSPQKPTVHLRDANKVKTAIANFAAKKTDKIDLSTLRFESEDFALVGNVSSVPKLFLGNSTIKDADMELVAKLPNLKELDLTRTRITDKGILFLKDHQTLENLYLSQTQISDKGLETIATIPNLKHLILWRCNITDAGCMSLAKTENLVSLSLDETMISDRGVRQLLPLKNLKELKIIGTRVTDAGINAAKRNWSGIVLNQEFMNK